jgi:hypothetical protein
MKLEKVIIGITIIILALVILSPALETQSSKPRKSANACSGVHGNSYYLYVEIISYTIPTDVDVGGSDTISATVEITGNGNDAYWECDLTVKITTQNSLISISNSPQSDYNLRPYFSDTYVFNFDGTNNGQDTITIEAIIYADHGGRVVSDSVIGSINVNLPQLAPELGGVKVTPESGTTDTTFTYSTVYTDDNNDAPDHIKVIIDDETTGHSMYVNTSASSYLKDGDYSNGEQYIFSTLLSAGTHTFYINTTDGLFWTESSMKNLPTVSSPQNKIPELLNPLVTPLTGYIDQEFTFTVEYTDLDDEAPQIIQIFINDDTTGFDMQLNTSADSELKDGNYINGEAYEYKTMLTEGSHTFKIKCSDGIDNVTTSIIEGPTVYANPKPVAVISSPENQTIVYSDDTIVFDASDSIDPSGNGLSYKWSSNISGLLSTEIRPEIQLELGYHMVTLEVTDSKSSKDTTWIDVYVIQRVILPPEISYWLPENDLVEVYESNTEFFNITAKGEGMLVYRWILDDNKTDSESDRFAYSTMPPAVGEHILEVIVELEDHPELNTSHRWSITVLDPTPQLVSIDPTENLSAEIDNRIEFSIEASDPQDLELEIDWYLNGKLKHENEQYTYQAKEEGFDIVKVVVTNLQGYSVEYEWNIFVGNDPQPEIPDEDNDDPIVTTQEPSELGSSELALILITAIFVIVAGINLFIVIFRRKRDSSPPSSEVELYQQVQPPVRKYESPVEVQPQYISPPPQLQYIPPPPNLSNQYTFYNPQLARTEYKCPHCNYSLGSTSSPMIWSRCPHCGGPL